MAANLFLVGYVIHQVGAEHYGGWTVVVAFTTYLSRLDAGFTVALQHHIARAHRQGDRKAELEIYNSAGVLYLAAAVVALGLGLLGSMFFSDLFQKVPENSAAECTAGLRWVAVGMAAFLVNMSTQGVLLGLQRHAIRNLIEISSLVLRVGVVVVLFALKGPSLEYLGVGFLAATLLRLSASLGVLHRVAPGLKVRPGAISWTRFKELLAFGSHSLLWVATKRAIQETGPVIAMLLFGPVMATYLYLGTRLANAVGGLIITGGTVFIPLASSMTAGDDQANMRGLFLRATRFCALLALSGGACLVLFGQPVLDVWVGPGYEFAYTVLVIVTVSMVIPWAFQAADGMFKGMRLLRPLTLLSLSQLVVVLVVAPLLGWIAGPTWFVVGLFAPIAVTFVAWMPAMASRHLDVDVGTLVRESVPGPLLVAGVVAVCGLGLQRIWTPDHVVILVLECAAVLVVFATLTPLIGLDQRSRDVAWGWLRSRRRAG